MFIIESIFDDMDFFFFVVKDNVIFIDEEMYIWCFNSIFRNLINFFIK